MSSGTASICRKKNQTTRLKILSHSEYDLRRNLIPLICAHSHELSHIPKSGRFSLQCARRPLGQRVIAHLSFECFYSLEKGVHNARLSFALDLPLCKAPSTHATLEGFENGGFTLNTHQMFSVHTTPEELKNTTITGYFGFVFVEN